MLQNHTIMSQLNNNFKELTKPNEFQKKQKEKL